MVQLANGAGSGGADVLENVELFSFTATPSEVGPFGASRLTWEVRGPGSGFVVRLNGATVARNGEEFVQPPQTATYRLSAVSAGATKFLGVVTVEVDRSACQVNSLFNPETAVKSFLNGQLGGRSDVTLQGAPSVSFSAGTIEFRVQFGVAGGPFLIAGGEATIDATLRLRVQGGHVVSETKSIYSDVSFSIWANLASVFSAGLSNSMDNGKAAVAKSAQDLVTGLGEFIDFLAVFPPGLVKNSVSIGVDDQGHGTIDVQACPNDLLVALSELSVNTTGKKGPPNS